MAVLRVKREKNFFVLYLYEELFFSKCVQMQVLTSPTCSRHNLDRCLFYGLLKYGYRYKLRLTIAMYNNKLESISFDDLKQRICYLFD